MATLVCFHAHPDDEAIATGGLMVLASDAGHRVVLVTATGGEHGEVADGVLDVGESLGERRAKELAAAARILGVSRTVSLGYVDSGMMGTPENDLASAFWQADVEEAAGRLAEVLRDEAADVLTIYDENGVYGHPDHIQVHRVGRRAAELAGTPLVYEATANRDQMRRFVELAGEATEGSAGPPLDPSAFGVPEARITTRLDVHRAVARKKEALAAHASQVPPESFFLTMSEEQFDRAFGDEWFVRVGAPEGSKEDFRLDGLSPAGPA